MTMSSQTKAAHTPGPWLADGATVYALNEHGSNRMVTHVQGGWAYGSGFQRTTQDELEANAAFIAKACNNYDALVKALSWFADPENWREEELSERYVMTAEWRVGFDPRLLAREAIRKATEG
jgi:hypothetical protein